MTLTQLEIDTDSASAEDLEDRLFALGAQSVSWVDAKDSDLIEATPGTLPVWAQVTLRALFDDAPRAELAAMALCRDTSTDGGVRLESIASRDWVRAGLEGLEPLRFGESLWVVPSWLESPATPGTRTLRLDPGLAFGTGNHSTTAMCLHALAEAPPRGRDVLDCGTGSGILAIAAVLLGARWVMATDVDPLALEAVRSNADANGIDTARIEVAEAAREIPSERFDLILANILAGPLIELQPRLTRALRPGGRILLSGLLESQIDPVARAYRDVIDLQVRATDSGWALLEGIRA